VLLLGVLIEGGALLFWEAYTRVETLVALYQTHFLERAGRGGVRALLEAVPSGIAYPGKLAHSGAMLLRLPAELLVGIVEPGQGLLRTAAFLAVETLTAVLLAGGFTWWRVRQPNAWRKSVRWVGWVTLAPAVGLMLLGLVGLITGAAPGVALALLIPAFVGALFRKRLARIRWPGQLLVVGRLVHWAGLCLGVTLAVAMVAPLAVGGISVGRHLLGLPLGVVTNVVLEDASAPLAALGDPERQDETRSAFAVQERLRADHAARRRSFVPWRRFLSDDVPLPPETCAELERLALSAIEAVLDPPMDEAATARLTVSADGRRAHYDLTVSHWHGSLAGAWRSYEVRLERVGWHWLVTSVHAGWAMVS